VSKRLYVGNLPASATESTLSSKFSEHGKVSGVRLITDHGTGRSLGYAFVEMATAAEAKRVIEELHGERYDGRELNVRTADAFGVDDADAMFRARAYAARSFTYRFARACRHGAYILLRRTLP